MSSHRSAAPHLESPGRLDAQRLANLEEVVVLLGQQLLLAVLLPPHGWDQGNTLGSTQNPPQHIPSLQAGFKNTVQTQQRGPPR